MMLLRAKQVVPGLTTPGVSLDHTLLIAVLAAVSIGLVVVASASVNYAQELRGDALYFFKRHLAYLMIAGAAAVVAYRLPIRIWYQLSPYMLLGSLFLLVVVLIPGVGLRVNGAQRWLDLGLMTLQVSEVAKVGMIFFLAGYMVRRGDELRTHWHGFAVPVGILALMAVLLLAEPDFGSMVVLGGVTFAMLFLAGIPLGVFVLMAVVALIGFAFFALSSPYRLERITGFLDPWADQFNSGYQLTQSLIAFGRGEWFGVGLGNSLQKLFYLPEAHTDFIFAIIAEELGLFGALLVLGLFVFLIYRIFALGMKACRLGEHFGGYVALGVATLFALQVAINIGVASGLFPTKGLTLPFVSYGGSSLLICTVLVGFCLRLSREVSLLQQPRLRQPRER